jgi:pimeloyl-ACP methyl ester carboxylesterase
MNAPFPCRVTERLDLRPWSVLRLPKRRGRQGARCSRRARRRPGGVADRQSREFVGNDPFFLPRGAEAFRRDIPSAMIHFFDTGHFALETHATEIAAMIRDFFAR